MRSNEEKRVETAETGSEPNDEQALLEQRYQQLELVYHLTDAINRAPDIEKLYVVAMDGLQQSLQADRVAILHFDDEGVMQFKAWKGLSSRYRQTVAGHSPWSADDQNPQPVLVADIKEEPSLTSLCETILREGIRALGFIPLIYQGNLLGKFMLYYDEPHDFTDTEVQLAQLIAGDVAFALERERAKAALQVAYDELEDRVERRTALLKQQIRQRRQAEEALQQESANVKLLQEVAVAANEAQSVKEALQFALDKICQRTGWPLGHVYTVSPQGKLVSSGLWHSNDGERFEFFIETTKATRFEPGEGWLGQVFSSGQPDWLTSTKDPDFLRNHRLKELGITSGFAFPVRAGSDVVAVLEFFSPQMTGPDDRLLEAMSHIGTQLGRVVERDRAAQALRDSERRFRAIFNQTFQFIGLLSPEGVLLEANETVLRFAGVTREEVVGKPFWETYWWTISPQTQQQLQAAIEEAAAGNFVRYEVDIQGAEGTIVTVDFSLKPVYDDDGHVVLLIPEGRDITRRKQTMKRLLKSKMLLAEAQRLAHIGSWEWDVVNDTITWSEELYRIYGLAPEEFTPSYDAFLKLVHPDDRETIDKAVRTALDAKEPFEFYHRIIRKEDGQVRVVHGQGQPILNEAGEVARMYGTGQDITKRKQNEAKLAKTAQQLAALNEMGQTIASSLELDVILDRVLESLRPLLQAEGVFILLRDKEEFVFAAANEVGVGNLQGQRVPVDAGVAGEVAHHGQSVWVSGEETVERVYRDIEEVAHYVPRAILATPLRIRDELIGVMEAVHSQEDVFQQDDLALLEAAATWTSIAISNARQHESLQRQLQESDAIATISRALNETLDLEQVLQLIVDTANRIIPQVDWVAIHLLDETTDTLRPATVTGLDLQADEHVLSSGEGIAGQVVEEGNVVNVADLQNDPRRLPDDRQMQIRSLLVAPVQSHTRRIGTISVQCATEDAYSAEDERLLTILGAQAAMAIENARLFEAQRQARQTAETLRTANMTMTQTLDLDTVLETLLNYLSQLIDYSSADVMLREESLLRIYALRGYAGSVDDDQARQHVLRPSWYPHIEAVFTQKESVVISDTDTYPGWQPHFEGAEVRSWLGVPLLARNKIIGLCSLGHTNPSYFTAEHRVLAEALTAQAASAVQNAQLFNQVRVGRERLRKLTARVVSAQEKERQRVSRELHDEAGQALTALKISLDMMQATLPEELASIKQNVTEAVDLTDETMERIRMLAHDLRPPALDTIGLNLTLEGLCRDFGQRTQLPVKYESVDLPAIPDPITISLYRFVQEALTNITKHARASQVEVTLHYDGDLIQLSVADDGRGFNAEQVVSSRPGSGIGLIGMYERLETLDGRLEIESEPGKGTRLVAYVPFREETPDE